jgi:hypothetical protein
MCAMAHHNSHTVPMDTICLSLNQQNKLATFNRVGQGRTKAELAVPLFFVSDFAEVSIASKHAVEIVLGNTLI